MNIDRYLALGKRLQTKMSLWIAMCIFLMILNGALMIFLYIAYGHNRTIVIPGELCKSFWMEPDAVSPEYLEQMAIYFVDRMMTYNPESLDMQINSVLPLADPTYYDVLRRLTVEQIKKIKEQKISSSYYINGVQARGLSVTIQGVLVIMMAGEIISQSPYALVVTFSNYQGRLYVASMIKRQG
ncbi:MAG: hypothetical protein HKM02_00535 [Pseudomonadales bacterium]|nr:hypothetical protein [Pseudomonadales bacterium]